ncbi:MAG: beta-galactosidase [Phycisphaerae bacterium]|nr:beta-galactosidase [Phycisphaerae bacterium]
MPRGLARNVMILFALIWACLPGASPAAGNLVANSSFEVVLDGKPIGWSWSAGRATGQIRIDEQVAHSGSRSVFIKNASPQAPHVYSLLRTRALIVPGRTYTLSCYVRSNDPGIAWIGGGQGWRIRLAFPKTGDQWQRVSQTFEARPEEGEFDLLIITENPTEGFWVDSVQLVEGGEPGQYVPPLAAGKIRLQLETDAKTGVGENLVANPSFEVVDGQGPKHWAWNKRNTDSTMQLVGDARSGKHAVRIANKTPYGPHVYGQLTLKERISLKPGDAYALSFYAKSDDPGQAWVGGGEGWHMRTPIRKTGGVWKRFSQSFVARDGDARFSLMINTDSPTSGFLVDDVKLEHGERATPFIEPSLADRPIEIVLDLPDVLSCDSTEMSVTALAFLRKGAPPAPAEVVIADAAGRTVAQTATDRKLAEGLNRLAVTWAPVLDRPSRYCLTIKVGAAVTEQSFDLFTIAQYPPAERATREAIQALRQEVDDAAKRNVPADYAKAALAVAEHFVGIAAMKRDVNRIPDAIDDLTFIAELCDARRKRLQEVIAGKLDPWTAPNPPLDKIRIRDGNFLVGTEPVMLVGGMGFGELHDALPTYRDYGFNVLGDDFNSYSAFRMVTGENEYDETAIPKLRESWQRLGKMNLAIAYNPTLHYSPEWALLKYRDITGGDPVDCLPDWSGLGRHQGKRTKGYGGFFPFAIDSPSLRKLVSRYYAKLMPALKDLSAFHVIWLMNEPTYKSRDKHYIELFRQYLRDKFKTIDKLNAAWGTRHESFEAIGYPEQRDAPPKFDWLTFHQDQVASWFEWLAAQVKARYPKAILSNKPMAWSLLHPEEGIDWEREAELWEVPGCDASRTPHNDRYAFGWIEAAMLFDFQRSVAPDKPLGDHEYHYVHWPNVTAEYVRATYFHSYLHGLRMSQFWVWATGRLDEGKAGAGMTHTAWSQPKVAWGTSSAALDLRRLAKVVAAFPQRPEVLIYLSRPSLYVDAGAHSPTLRNAYEASNGLDAAIGFATDKMIRSGRLAGCKLLIVPAAKHVEADVLAGIQRFVDGGGRVVLIDECLTKDPYGRAHAKPLNVPQQQCRRANTREVEPLVPLLDEALAAANITRPVRALGQDGKPAWPVECRSAQVDGQRICYLVGLNKEPETIKLLTQEPVRQWTDMITGQTGTSNRFEIKPLDVRLLCLTP